tara:strand:- start:24548 stop:24943 length:396 start_codon:yes stop_codon:yes gene_type:complete
MKKNTPWQVGLGVLLLCGTVATAQQNTEQNKKPSFKVKKYTIMEQFEPDMVVPVDKRILLKEERFEQIQERREILDTLDISERKKRKILRDIYMNPLSDRLSEVLVTEKDENPNKSTTSEGSLKGYGEKLK